MLLTTPPAPTPQGHKPGTTHPAPPPPGASRAVLRLALAERTEDAPILSTGKCMRSKVQALSLTQPVGRERGPRGRPRAELERASGERGEARDRGLDAPSFRIQEGGKGAERPGRVRWFPQRRVKTPSEEAAEGTGLRRDQIFTLCPRIISLINTEHEHGHHAVPAPTRRHPVADPGELQPKVLNANEVGLCDWFETSEIIFPRRMLSSNTNLFMIRLLLSMERSQVQPPMWVLSKSASRTVYVSLGLTGGQSVRFRVSWA